MTKSLWWVIALFVAGCLESHDPQTQTIAKDYCYGCHAGEYNATGTTTFPLAPVHATSQCSTECALCHTTTTWVNQLGGCVHPEQAFPLASMGTKHTNIACTDCHSAAISVATGATSQKGANTDCISCHPNTSTQQSNHVGVTYDSGTLLGQPYSYLSSDHRFCLDCHPNGLAVGHGGSNPFIIPHHGATCAQCHDSASGLGHTNGADVLCVTSGCHRDAHHKDTNHDPGCLAAGCHPDGRSHGD
jgi:hypothetical protein